MPIFDLTVNAATLSHGVGEGVVGYNHKWTFGMDCQLNAGTIRLCGDLEANDCRLGGTLKCSDDLDRYVNALIASGMPQPKEPVVGLLHFFKERSADPLNYAPPTILFDVNLSADLMADVVSMAKVGRYPAKLVLEVADDSGIKYGWEPDGSGLDWDTDGFSRVPIIGAELEYRLHEPEGEALVPVSERPVTTVAAELLPVLHQIRSRLGAVVLAVIGIIAVVLFRHATP